MPELYNYTVQRLCDDIRRQMSDSAGIRFRDDMIISWINDTQREIGQQTNFLQKSAKLQLLAGQATYNIGTLLASHRFINFGSIMAYGRKLEQIKNREYLERIAQNDTPTASTGQPEYVSEFDDVLNLWPVPNLSVAGALVIYGTAVPDDISSVDDRLTVPDRFYDPLFQGVLARAMQFDERPEESQAAVAQRDASIMREQGRKNRNPDDQNPTIDWSYENDDYRW